MKKNMTRMLAWILCVSLLLGTPVMATGSGESNTSDSSPVLLADMGDESKDIPVEGITATAGDSQSGYGPELALDGKSDTKWETNWYTSNRADHWVILDLGGSYPVDGLRYLPRQDAQLNGTITKYEIWGSNNGTDFVKVYSGEWAADHDWKSASFGPYNMTHLKLVVLQGSPDAGNPSLPLASAAEIRVTQAEAGETYTVNSFTEESHGGWQVAQNSGTGTIEFADGKMELWGKGDTGNTAYYDANSPKLADGYVEATITPVTNSRFALLYRYTDSTHYTGISYDAGSWGWCGNGGNKWGNLTADASYAVEAGKTFTLRLVFSGADVKVLVDGVQVAHGTIDDPAISQEAGYMGFRMWGDGDESNRGHIKVSKVEMGTMTASELPEPEEPVESVDEKDEDGNYLVTFTDASKRGELALKSGDGTVNFQDGEGANGYATVSKVDGTTTKALFMVGRSPKVENGFLQADVTNLSGGRLGLAFRIQDNGDYVSVVYDVGTWQITKSGNQVASFEGGAWNKNETKSLRVDFAGTKITVTINGSRVFSQDIPGLAGTGSGKVGAVVWGYDSGDNQGKAKLDNIVVGQRVAVELSPEEYSLSYAEAGTTKMTVRLGETAEQNPLTAIKLGEQELGKDTDYTVSGNAVTLKGSLITEEMKEAGGTTFTFVFEDGFEASFHVLIQAKPQENQINYVRDFSTDPTQGENPMAVLSGSANLRYDGEKKALIISNAQNAFLVDQSAPQLKNCDVEFTFNLTTDSGSFAALARYNEGSYVAMGPNSSSGIAWSATSNSGSMGLPNYEDGNQMFGSRTVPYTVRVRFLEKTAVVWGDNYEMWSGPVDCFNGGNGLAGILVKGATMELLSFKVTSVDMPVAEKTTGEEKAISSDSMSVTMDSSFPRVIKYTLDGKTLNGQEIPYYVVELNNKEYKPQVTSEFTDSTATYHMTVNVSENQTVTFDAVFTVTDNVLQMKLKNIDDSAYHLYNINFPVHSLVSVSSAQAGAELRAANYSTSEVRQDLTTQPASDMYESASIVVISNNELAASINNESYNGHRGISYQTMRNGDHTTTGLWSTGFPYRGLDDEIMFYEPWVKVAVTGDRNQDNKVDYQDGAIARRDDCQKDGQKADAYGYETVMGSYNTIAMDVGSAAQYPFLRILDNIKKMSLGLDNFPQTVIIKGYNGQGHDSNNNDFANYNEAAGGLKDFNTLLSASEDYNTNIGIHINETETYPESATYGRLATSLGGWPWYDVARLIHHDNDSLDKSENGMAGRLDQLNEDTNNMLDLIYVDVYHKTRWPMYTLVNKINSMGMAMATEYPSAVDQHSVWAHHVGGHVTQDSQAGNLIRFVNNQYQDIFGSSSLFRGTSRVSGINGWQNASDYNGSLEHFYTSVLPNRFLVQYPIMQWESTDKVVLGENLNVVTKMEGGTNVITLDGNEVARGNKIFIPFTVDGVEKIYHWNDQTGDTTWTLPSTFAGQTSVKVFQLSDQGRTNMQTVAVQNGKVTIHATAKTPYVIYKGDANVDVTGSLTSYDWGQGGLVKDPGFDSFTPGYGWTVENAQFWDNDHENTYLVMNGAQDGSATQTISGLTPGKTYQASVWAEVSGKTASITVRDGDTQLATNYMTQSNVIYGIHHTDKYQRYLQRMWVEFTAPESGTVTLALTGTNGTGDSSYVHFDDVRIVEHTPSDPGSHTYYEDFENTTEGYGIFVSTESDTSHLSETNDPYTFDTIDGRFSLKTRAGDYFRTLPHTLRLQPNTKYTIGLEYIAGSAGQVFTLAVKSDKAAAAQDTANAVVGSIQCSAVGNWGENAPVTLTFTTGNYDDYYVDITKSGSISEYAIDNFYVDEISEASKDSLQALYTQCQALTQADYTPETWAVLTEKMTAAKTVLDKADASQQEIQQAQDALQAAKDALVAYAKAEDLERLQAVITEMEAVKPDYYHQDEQWTAFQNKITEAKALKETEKVTVPQVDDMIQALRDAKSALNSLVDKNKLQELYDFCAAIPQNDVMDGNELVAFLKARSEAETVLKDETAQQSKVDDALKALSDTYEKIVPKRTTNEGHTDAAIVTELAAKLAEAQAVEQPSDALTAAIAQAKAASESMATWKSVVEAIAALEAAMPGQPEQKVTVTFDTQGGSKIDPVEVEKGGTIAQPDAPTRSSYTFTGWYLDQECTKPFTFSTPVTEDLTLYAGWRYQGGSSGGSSGGSGNKTETTTNPDGSTTTTVTKPDGTVTETTKWPDGSKEVVVTDKNGTVTTTTTDKNGNKTEVVENTDGSSKTTVDNKDGSGSVTVVDKDGNVVSKATLSQAAVEAAQAAGESVALPMPQVPVTTDRENAPTVTVKLPQDDAVLVEIPVDDVTTGTVAVLVKADGTEEIIKTSLPTEDGVAVTLKDGDTVKIVDNSKNFTDVPNSYWGSQYIDFVTSRELFSGTGADTFSPDVTMTRGMIVTVLAAYDGANTASTGGAWYEAGRQWAMENGISDGSNMEQTLTREQLAVMLWRYAGSPDSSSDLSSYADAGSISSYAQQAMKWAVQEGLISGVGNNALNPQGQASRVQVAIILMRFIESGLK